MARSDPAKRAGSAAGKKRTPPSRVEFLAAHGHPCGWSANAPERASPLHDSTPGRVCQAGRQQARSGKGKGGGLNAKRFTRRTARPLPAAATMEARPGRPGSTPIGQPRGSRRRNGGGGPQATQSGLAPPRSPQRGRRGREGRRGEPTDARSSSGGQPAAAEQSQRERSELRRERRGTKRAIYGASDPRVPALALPHHATQQHGGQPKGPAARSKRARAKRRRRRLRAARAVLSAVQFVRALT